MKERFVPDEITEFAKGVEKVYDPEDTAEIETLKDLASKLNLKWRGSGIHCAVVSHPSNEKKVFAIDYGFTDIEAAKKIFLTQKILSTLFPHNFPRFHASAGHVPGLGHAPQMAGTIRQTIEGAHGGNDGYEPTVSFATDAVTPSSSSKPTVTQPSNRDEKIKYPFKDIVAPLQRFGMQYFLDTKKDNFILTRDGAEYFVDILATTPLDEWDTGAIEEYMNEQKIDDGAKETVRDAIIRLRKLQN
ncbi:MAG: hypothetical protein AAB927_01980 [Patescibacteria group bacterium]